MPSRNRPNNQVLKKILDDGIYLIGTGALTGFGDTNFSFRVFLESSRYFLELFCARLLGIGLVWWQNDSFSKKEGGAGGGGPESAQNGSAWAKKIGIRLIPPCFV